MKKITRCVAFGLFGALLVGSIAAIGTTSTKSLIGTYDPKEDAYINAIYTDEEVANMVKAQPFYTPTDTYYNTQKNYSMNNVGNIQSVWDNYKGDGVTIAVIDSGINYMHPDFYSDPDDYTTCKISPDSTYVYTNGNTGYTKTAVGARTTTSTQSSWNILLHNYEYDSSSGKYKFNAHGSNVASTAAAFANGEGVVGIAPNATILALKVDFYLPSISKAIEYATDHGADVINMSLGAYATSFVDGNGKQQSGVSSTATAFTSAINYAYNHGVIVVAAAGNEATSEYSYPASNAHVIGVGALNKNSNTDAASFSNFNKSTDTATGNHNVDIMAPGYVYASDLQGTDTNPTYTSYCATQGTSFASPIVAGAAALYKQKYPAATPDQFERDLYQTASDIGNENWDTKFGYGRMDIGNLMSLKTDVTGIQISQSSANLYLNPTVDGKDAIQLTANVLPVIASDTRINWSTGNSNIASVSTSGLVTAKGVGSTTITATTVDGGYTATCDITVSNWVAVTSISVKDTDGNDSCQIAKHKTKQLVTTISPSNATDQDYIYMPDDESIVSVSDDGLVTGLAVGETDICVLSDDGYFEDYYHVEVTAPSGSGNIFLNFYNAGTLTTTSGTGASLDYINNHTTLNGVANNKLFSNYNSNSTTIQYDKNGGLCFGASSKNGKLSITLASDYTIEKITIVGSSYDTNATFKINSTSGTGSLGGKQVALENVSTSLVFENIKSNNLVIESVNNRATIYTMEIEYSSSADTVPVTGVAIKNHEGVEISNASLEVGETEQLSAVVSPDNATNKAVTWTSGSSSVATVSSSGLVTAVSAGSTTITVTTTDGNKTDSINLTVTAPVVDSVTIDPTASVKVGETTTISATASGTVTWTKTDGTGSITLSNQSNTGVTITGVTAGSATITATVGSASATCNVTVTASSGGTTKDVQYVFNSKSWGAKIGSTTKNWTSGKEGNGFTSNQGVQVTKGTTGANGTCKESYSNISKVIVSYCTNASSGAGSIAVSIGSSNDSQSVSTSGGTTPRDLTFNFADTPTGNVKIAVTCSTNSIYIYGCTITYSESGTPTPDPVHVSGITLNKQTLTLDVDATETLVATIAPDNADDKSVTWSSSDNSVATVDSTGKVTAVKAGSATITVRSNDVTTIFATCAVTVNESGGGGDTPGEGEWVRVDKVSDLSANDKIVIASSAKGAVAGDIANQIMGYIKSSTFSSDGSKITSLGDGALQLKVGISGSNYTFANASGSLLGATAVKKLAWGSGTTTWTISIEEGAATITNTTTTNGKIMCNSNSGQERFTSYTSTVSENMTLPSIYKYVTSSGDDALTEAVNWAKAFVNNLTCNNGVTAPSTSVWSTYATSFASLSSDAKNILVNATYTLGVDGTTVTPGTEVNQYVAEAVARYDAVISRYGTTNYTNFMSRTVTSNMMNALVTDNGVVIVSCLVIVLMITCAGVYFFKKKRTN